MPAAVSPPVPAAGRPREPAAMTLVRADTGQGDQADRGRSADPAAAEQPALRPAVSVVICAGAIDRWEELKQAVVSVGAQAADEIVLVVDHCPELLAQAELLAQLLPWTIVVAPNRFQPGLPGARDTGMAISQGDIVAFLGDGAAADPGWLAAMAGHYQDPRVLGVGGMVRPDWQDGRPPWFASELDWVVGCCYQGMPASSVPVRSFLGANMSFRCTVLEDCGGFSSAPGGAGALPPGCAETELCLRISQRHPDGILLYEPAAAVSQKVPGEHARWRYLRSRCYQGGRSRAMAARLAGPSRARAAGRSYVRPAMPRGIWRCLTGAPGGRLSGVMAALTMVMAVAMTTVGYLAGTVTARRAGTYPRRPTTGRGPHPLPPRHHRPPRPPNPRRAPPPSSLPPCPPAPRHNRTPCSPNPRHDRTGPSRPLRSPALGRAAVQLFFRGSTWPRASPCGCRHSVRPTSAGSNQPDSAWSRSCRSLTGRPSPG